MELKTLYLQAYWSYGGRNSLQGRQLYNAFANASRDKLLGHMVVADRNTERYTSSMFMHDIVSQREFLQLEPNVVYCESGLFCLDFNDEVEWKIASELAKEYVMSGGVLVIADADINDVRQHKHRYRGAYPLIRAFVDYGPNDKKSPVYCIDQVSSWRGDHQILCNPEEMVVSDWLQPAFDEVDQILVGLPVALSSFESIAASCNKRTSSTLQEDVWVDPVCACPYASVAKVGYGYTVFVAGSLSSDIWIQKCPGNARWLINLCELLVAEASQNLEHARSYLRSPYTLFLSHRSVNKTIVESIARSLKYDKGMNTWFDKDRLIPSDSLIGEISRALDNMTHFILFWSKECRGASWVERELRVAASLLIERGLPIIIVRLDDEPVPTIVRDLFRIEARELSAEEISDEISQAVSRLAKRK